MEGLVHGGAYFRNFVQWLVGTKHFPESKTCPKLQNDFPKFKKTLQIQTRPRIQKHPPESKNTSQKPNSRTWFGFWGAFCPHKAPYFWLVTQDHKLQVKTICSRCSKGHPCKPFLFYVACKTVIKVTRKNFRVHMKESWLWGVSFPPFPSVF